MTDGCLKKRAVTDSFNSFAIDSEQKIRLTSRRHSKVCADVVEAKSVGSRANIVSSVPFSGVVYNESTHICAVVPCHEHAAVGASEDEVSFTTDSHCAVTGGDRRVDSPQPLNNQHTWIVCSQVFRRTERRVANRPELCGTVPNVVTVTCVQTCLCGRMVNALGRHVQ